MHSTPDISVGHCPGRGVENTSAPLYGPPQGEYQVPGYPEKKFREEPIRNEEPEIPSEQTPIIPELDHRKFNHIEALETVPPFNP